MTYYNRLWQWQFFSYIFPFNVRFFLTTSLISKELNIITINQEWMNEGCQKKIGYVIALSLVSLNIIKIVQTKYWIIPYLRRGWGGLNLDTTIPTFLFPITGGGGGVKRGRTIFTIFAVFFLKASLRYYGNSVDCKAC